MKKTVKWMMLLTVLCLSLALFVACDETTTTGTQEGATGNTQTETEENTDKINVKIVGATFDENMHLILQMSDGTTVDGGEVKADVDENNRLVLTLPDGTKIDGGVEVKIPDAVYTVTYQDHEGKVIHTEQVAYGKDATPPTAPERTGYRFTGWDGDDTAVKENVTLTAQYVKQVTVTFRDYNGTILKTQTVDSGTGATAPSNPTRTGYVFNGWDASFSYVTADTTVKATYLIAVDRSTVQLTETEAKAGATQVAVKILLRKNPGISSMVLTLDYDKTALTLTGYTYDARLSGQKADFDPNEDSSSLAWTNFGASNVNGDFTYATLYFTVNASATVGKKEITVSYNPGNVLDKDNNSVAFDVISGGITVVQ